MIEAGSLWWWRPTPESTTVTQVRVRRVYDDGRVAVRVISDTTPGDSVFTVDPSELESLKEHYA